MPVCVRRVRAEPVDGGWPGAERERPGPREGYESILHKMRSHWEFNSVLYFNWKMVDLQCRGFKCRSFEVRQTSYLSSNQFNMFGCVS